MIYPEAVFLRQAEYKAGLKNRYDETEIIPGEDLCSIMFSLTENNRGREAATLPAQVLGKTALHESGLHEVSLTILDKDLAPSLNVTALFMNGLWIDVKKRINVVDPNEGQRLSIPPTEAYISDYDDGLDGLWDIVASEKNELILSS